MDTRMWNTLLKVVFTEQGCKEKCTAVNIHI